MRSVVSRPTPRSMMRSRRLVFMAEVEEGLAQLDAGQGISHEEVKRRFGA